MPSTFRSLRLHRSFALGRHFSGWSGTTAARTVEQFTASSVRAYSAAAFRKRCDTAMMLRQEIRTSGHRPRSHKSEQSNAVSLLHAPSPASLLAFRHWPTLSAGRFLSSYDGPAADKPSASSDQRQDTSSAAQSTASVPAAVDASGTTALSTGAEKKGTHKNDARSSQFRARTLLAFVLQVPCGRGLRRQ